MEISFPSWVRRIKDADRQRAARLRYILFHVMLEVDGNLRLTTLARSIGYDHSSLACALRRGRMSYEMAFGIQEFFGRNVVRYEHLMDPMTA